MRDGYEDYARFLCHVKMKSAEHDSRCEIVTGRYFSENLKKGVRDNRCSGLLFSFSDPFFRAHRWPQNAGQNSYCEQKNATRSISSYFRTILDRALNDSI